MVRNLYKYITIDHLGVSLSRQNNIMSIKMYHINCVNKDVNRVVLFLVSAHDNRIKKAIWI